MGGDGLSSGPGCAWLAGKKGLTEMSGGSVPYRWRRVVVTGRANHDPFVTPPRAVMSSLDLVVMRTCSLAIR